MGMTYVTYVNILNRTVTVEKVEMSADQKKTYDQIVASVRASDPEIAALPSFLQTAETFARNPVRIMEWGDKSAQHLSRIAFAHKDLADKLSRTETYEALEGAKAHYAPKNPANTNWWNRPKQVMTYEAPDVAERRTKLCSLYSSIEDMIEKIKTGETVLKIDIAVLSAAFPPGNIHVDVRVKSLVSALQVAGMIRVTSENLLVQTLKQIQDLDETLNVLIPSWTIGLGKDGDKVTDPTPTTQVQDNLQH